MKPRFAADEIATHWPEWGEDEQRALSRVLSSGRWTRVLDADPDHSETGQAEAELARYLGIRHFLGVATGTVALELALLAVGVSVGDEVIVPACAFIAVPLAVVRCGAMPVFADVEPVNGTLDPGSLEARLTRRTRAVVVVHPCGIPPDMNTIARVCKLHGVSLIEDCAHAWGSRSGAHSLGTYGDIGCFSFVQGKALSCGEGGGLSTADDNFAARVAALHNPFPIASARVTPAGLLGTTARLSNWHAAILRCQLRRVDQQIERRRENWNLLQHLLDNQDSPLRCVDLPAWLTRWNVYDPPFEYRPENFGGRSKWEFIPALHEHGVPVEPGHFDPVYGWRQIVESAITCRNPGCPAADMLGACRVVIRQQFFLGPREWMHRLADLLAELSYD
jgi:dTDP-4-amino-4,6-dideoxygalactose transaminase